MGRGNLVKLKSCDCVLGDALPQGFNGANVIGVEVDLLRIADEWRIEHAAPPKHIFMQRNAVDHGVIQERQQLKTEGFRSLDFARLIQVVDFNLDIDHAPGWHVAAGSAFQFVDQIDAVRAPEYAQAVAFVKFEYLADMLQDRGSFFLDVLNVGFGGQEINQLSRGEGGANWRGGILYDEWTIELGELAVIFAHFRFGRFAQVGRHGHQCGRLMFASMTGEIKGDALIQTLNANDKRRATSNLLARKSHDLLAFGIAEREELAGKRWDDHAMHACRDAVLYLAGETFPVNIASVIEGCLKYLEYAV